MNTHIYSLQVSHHFSAPRVLTYMDRAHNEIKSIWHDGTLSTDRIENITQGIAPSFSYNSQGHLILQNDNQISHAFNHNRNVVHAISLRREETVDVAQMNFTKEAQSLEASNPFPQTAGTEQTTHN